MDGANPGTEVLRFNVSSEGMGREVMVPSVVGALEFGMSVADSDVGDVPVSVGWDSQRYRRRLRIVAPWSWSASSCQGKGWHQILGSVGGGHQR